VDRDASRAAMGFEQDAFRTLDALQRFADRVRQAAVHFELHSRMKVAAGLIRATEAVQHQAAVVIDPWIAAAVDDRRVQRVERFTQIA
jgi:hypothetical protein